MQGASGGWVYQISAARSFQKAREMRLPDNRHAGAATFAFLHTCVVNKFKLT